MAIGGAGDYGFLFNSNSGKAGLANALFGSKNTMLSDYSMIKSGAYKKLLTAYYKKQNEDSDTKTKNAEDKTKKHSTKTEEDNPNLAAKTAADQLKTSVNTLQDRGLYQAAGKTENGKEAYDRERIQSAVTSFVSDYNSAISRASQTSSTVVKSRALDLEKATASHSRALGEIGITVNKNQELVVDTEKLGKADVSKISSLFAGSGNYASRVSSVAGNLSQAAYTAASSTSSYNQAGTYKNTGISSLLDQYL